jgi:hypothetical protein
MLWRNGETRFRSQGFSIGPHIVPPFARTVIVGWAANVLGAPVLRVSVYDELHRCACGPEPQEEAKHPPVVTRRGVAYVVCVWVWMGGMRAQRRTWRG